MRGGFILLLILLFAAAAPFAQDYCPVERVPTELVIYVDRDNASGVMLATATLTAIDLVGKTTQPLALEPVFFQECAIGNFTPTTCPPYARACVIAPGGDVWMCNSTCCIGNVVAKQTDADGKVSIAFPLMENATITALYMGDDVYQASNSTGAYIYPPLFGALNITVCFPLFLVLGLLTLSMSAMGRSPIAAFDFSSMHAPRARLRGPTAYVSSTGRMAGAIAGSIDGVASLTGKKMTSEEKQKQKEHNEQLAAGIDPGKDQIGPNLPLIEKDKNGNYKITAEGKAAGVKSDGKGGFSTKAERDNAKAGKSGFLRVLATIGRKVGKTALNIGTAKWAADAGKYTEKGIKEVGKGAVWVADKQLQLETAGQLGITGGKTQVGKPVVNLVKGVAGTLKKGVKVVTTPFRLFDDAIGKATEWATDPLVKDSEHDRRVTRGISIRPFEYSAIAAKTVLGVERTPHFVPIPILDWLGQKIDKDLRFGLGFGGSQQDYLEYSFDPTGLTKKFLEAQRDLQAYVAFLKYQKATGFGFDDAEKQLGERTAALQKFGSWDAKEGKFKLNDGYGKELSYGKELMADLKRMDLGIWDEEKGTLAFTERGRIALYGINGMLTEKGSLLSRIDEGVGDSELSKEQKELMKKLKNDGLVTFKDGKWVLTDSGKAKYKEIAELSKKKFSDLSTDELQGLKSLGLVENIGVLEDLKKDKKFTMSQDKLNDIQVFSSNLNGSSSEIYYEGSPVPFSNTPKQMSYEMLHRIVNLDGKKVYTDENGLAFGYSFAGIGLPRKGTIVRSGDGFTIDAPETSDAMTVLLNTLNWTGTPGIKVFGGSLGGSGVLERSSYVMRFGNIEKVGLMGATRTEFGHEPATYGERRYSQDKLQDKEIARVMKKGPGKWSRQEVDFLIQKDVLTPQEAQDMQEGLILRKAGLVLNDEQMKGLDRAIDRQRGKTDLQAFKDDLARAELTPPQVNTILAYANAKTTEERLAAIEQVQLNYDPEGRPKNLTDFTLFTTPTSGDNFYKNLKQVSRDLHAETRLDSTANRILHLTGGSPELALERENYKLETVEKRIASLNAQLSFIGEEVASLSSSEYSWLKKRPQDGGQEPQEQPDYPPLDSSKKKQLFHDMLRDMADIREQLKQANEDYGDLSAKIFYLNAGASQMKKNGITTTSQADMQEIDKAVNEIETQKRREIREVPGYPDLAMNMNFFEQDRITEMLMRNRKRFGQEDQWDYNV